MTTLNNCPYCKRELNGQFNVCPHCWRILLEIVGKTKTPTMDVANTQKEWKAKTINPNRVSLWKYLSRIWNRIKRRNPMTVLMSTLGLLVIIGVIFGNENNISSDNNNSPTTDNVQYDTDSPVLETTPKVAEDIILPENRLSNGQNIYKDIQYFKKYGANEITIDNTENNTDAIAKLVPVEAEKSIYTTYIRHWYKYTIKNIPNGNYTLYFAYCQWYNYGMKKPLWLYGSQRADEQYMLHTWKENTSDWYILHNNHLTISLYKKVDWNLTTTDILEGQFNDL